MVNLNTCLVISHKFPKNAVKNIWSEGVQGMTLATANCHLTLPQDNQSI